MLEKFRNIFEGLDYAYGAFVKQATSLPEAKTFSESIAKGSVKAKHGEDKPKESII